MSFFFHWLILSSQSYCLILSHLLYCLDVKECFDLETKKIKQINKINNIDELRNQSLFFCFCLWLIDWVGGFYWNKKLGSSFLVTSFFVFFLFLIWLNCWLFDWTKKTKNKNKKKNKRKNKNLKRFNTNIMKGIWFHSFFRLLFETTIRTIRNSFVKNPWNYYGFLNFLLLLKSEPKITIINNP